jgi:LPXTG-motif cell wall-anchored protein
MMRRTIAMGAGLLVLVALALLPSTASAQYIPPPTIETTTTSVLPNEETTTTTTTEPEETTTTAVEPDEVVPPTTEQVMGDVVRRPLPRTGGDLNGTAVFGGALTILGIALALGARRRRNAYEGR